MGVDAGPELATAALGKLAHMPYVWLPRRDLLFTTAQRRCKPAAPSGAAAKWWQFLTPGKLWLGRIAQLVEQLTLNQRVQGSSPCAPTK
jgi:hypothetical protein